MARSPMPYTSRSHLLGHEHRRPHHVGPVVVVREAAQRGLHAARDDGHAGERLAAALAVDGRRPVGPEPGAAARRVGVVAPRLPVRRVVVDHRVHVAGADAVEEPRPAQRAPRLDALPVGLGEDGDAVAQRLEPPPEDGHGERRVVDVGVAGDEHDVRRVDAARVELGAGHGHMAGGPGARGHAVHGTPAAPPPYGAGAVGLHEEKNSSIRRLTSGAFS